MIIIRYIFIFVMFSLVSAQAQKRDYPDFFYKTVDSKRGSDSIQVFLDSAKIDYLKFSQPCYWDTKDSLTIDYCNSHLYVFKDSNKYQTVFVTEFFIYKTEEDESKLYSFFEWNSEKLFATELRPDQRDKIPEFLDTVQIKKVGLDKNSLSKIDSIMYNVVSIGYKYYNRGLDGLPYEYIFLSLIEQKKMFSIDPYVFSPTNYYYRFNCTTLFFTLRLLCLNRVEELKIQIERDIELDNMGLLDSLGKLDINSNLDKIESNYEKQIMYWLNLHNHDYDTVWELKKKKAKKKK